ncbi:MAG: hypothetical protein ACYTDU_21085 [Planctomycetota bacterium]|jgi:hypothetical protein
MRKVGAVLLLAVATVQAQDDKDQVIPRIELFTRMKFRRPVPLRIESKTVWMEKQKASGYAGHSARHALAFYRPDVNDVTVIPWVIGRYPPPGTKGTPLKKTRQDWIADLEPTLIHELVHAIHHQNFYIEGRFYGASLRTGGLSEEEIDVSTVQFLLGEGFPEYVSLRTTMFPQHMAYFPGDEADGVRYYMRTYEPDGKQPYRIILSEHGYGDGLSLLHHLFLKAGPRGVRAALYRPPPRVLLFQPEILGAVELDDPPDPDSIFGFLSPEILTGSEVRLAVNPGTHRHFRSAARSGARARGCLIGYMAEVGGRSEPQGLGRYAFFVADPEHPGRWSEAQARSLKELHPTGVTEKQAKLPLVRGKGVKAGLITVKMPDGGLYVRAETHGLVVLAHESKPTRNLSDRVLRALRVLYLKRPKPKLYDQALAEATAKLNEK